MSTKLEAGLVKDHHPQSELLERWIRITNKIIRSESLPRDFGTGDLLFMSEVHTLCAIGAMPGINVTNLSVRLGVTKGAISKMTKKMEDKGLLERYHEPGNDKEVLIRLTPKGKKAYLGHENHHKEAFGRITTEVDKLTDEQMEFLFGVFTAIEEMIDTTPPERESGIRGTFIQEET
jgi:DNA-binding MarR family transcriptional regulator